jgi:capsular polysaccharide biosynthesis protein
VLLHPVLVGVVFGVCVLASLVATFSQSTGYTAEARVVVGRVDVRSNAVPGYSDANVALAETYSRFVGTTAHEKLMAEELGISVGDVRDLGTIDASPIPENPIIRVLTESTTEKNAVALAEAGTKALVKLVADTNDPTQRAEALFSQYSDAASAQSEAQGALDTSQRTLGNLVAANADAGSIAVAEQAVVEARTNLFEATARTQSLNELYQQSLVARSDGDLLRVLSEAEPTGSDQSQKRQFGLAVGVLVGGFVAVGLAWLVANWQTMMGMRANLRGISGAAGAARPRPPTSQPRAGTPERAASPRDGPPDPSTPAPPAGSESDTWSATASGTVTRRK